MTNADPRVRFKWRAKRVHPRRRAFFSNPSRGIVSAAGLLSGASCFSRQTPNGKSVTRIDQSSQGRLGKTIWSQVVVVIPVAFGNCAGWIDENDFRVPTAAECWRGRWNNPARPSGNLYKKSIFVVTYFLFFVHKQNGKQNYTYSDRCTLLGKFRYVLGAPEKSVSSIGIEFPLLSTVDFDVLQQCLYPDFLVEKRSKTTLTYAFEI